MGDFFRRGGGPQSTTNLRTSGECCVLSTRHMTSLTSNGMQNTSSIRLISMSTMTLKQATLGSRQTFGNPQMWQQKGRYTPNWLGCMFAEARTKKNPLATRLQ